MGFKNLHFFIFISIFLLQACSIKGTYNNKKDISFPYKSSYNYKVKKSLSYAQLYDALNFQYQTWKGVKYKYGGNSKNGIDCSAFVQKAFMEGLNIKLPRTTTLQLRVGKDVQREDLKMGDLVFFKTGFKTKHVGIYLEKGKFLHASTKRGVTISRLDNIYYSKHFWKIKRVIY